MQCKVKIGSAYEPKWFERRYTQGTYSAKNIPPCEETAWLQNAMLGTYKPKIRHKAILFLIASAVGIYCLAYL
jgi:hypothetical protein